MVKIRGLAVACGNRLEGSPALEQKRAEVALPHVLLLFRLLFFYLFILLINRLTFLLSSIVPSSLIIKQLSLSFIISFAICSSVSISTIAPFSIIVILHIAFISFSSIVQAGFQPRLPSAFKVGIDRFFYPFNALFIVSCENCFIVGAIVGGFMAHFMRTILKSYPVVFIADVSIHSKIHVLYLSLLGDSLSLFLYLLYHSSGNLSIPF